MRQNSREENGNNYDPIYLSDIESVDEWITEKDNRCLPIDASWMDVYECFGVDEGAPNKKRKRGPRNLNAKPDKEKSIIEYEEEIEDNEGEELLILEDEDDFSNVDLRIGDDE
ncbi:uncharacterized protein LOC114916238 [Cajanus cajan]|uniref:uncharacterized protein LOC114916238 n=1 Tax=Cajanus cajan TaxID=3821 RepID=UPI0010FBB55E|nr:uncharacterized protein LOC114916238 [Cajanus cajan]